MEGRAAEGDILSEARTQRLSTIEHLKDPGGEGMRGWIDPAELWLDIDIVLASLDRHFGHLVPDMRSARRNASGRAGRHL